MQIYSRLLGLSQLGSQLDSQLNLEIRPFEEDFIQWTRLMRFESSRIVFSWLDCQWVGWRLQVVDNYFVIYVSININKKLGEAYPSMDLEANKQRGKCSSKEKNKQ